MSHMKRLLGPPMSLVEDELIEIPCTPTKKGTYRIRVWMGKDAMPVVLANAVLGGVPTTWATRKLAHRVWSIYLGYLPTPFLFASADWRFREPSYYTEEYSYYDVVWAGPRESYRSMPMACHAYRMPKEELLSWIGRESLEM